MILQSYDPQTGAFASTLSDYTNDLYACRTVVPWPHKLVKATLTCQNTVTAGTVEIFLRFSDPGANRAGGQIGLKLENDDLDVGWALENNYSLWTFDLQAYKNSHAPANRQYFIQATATDAADRLDEPILILDVERV
jgi:hypothetical protein